MRPPEEGLSRLENIIANSKPSYILIELGGNDALRGYPPAKIKNNIQEMINLSIGTRSESTSYANKDTS